MFTTYQEAYGWIAGRMQFGVRPGLDRMRALLERLGHPERRLKFIHVAGTNGKGSTCAFLATVIQEAGYEVGLFTSPVMGKYTDRIQVNGRGIPEETVVELANRIREAGEAIEAEHGPVTNFEVSTALALLYFATVSYPDFVVWETGMGGRLDCTNVVAPLVSVITNVGLDHTDVLGETIAQIAREKAGIIKPGVPVVTTATDPEAAEAIRETAASRKSSLYELGRQFRFETREVQDGRQTFDFEGPFRALPGVAIGMDGVHQQTNAALALMTVEVLRQYYALIVDDDVLYASFERARWPGRLETVATSPRIVLDGAHNAEGAAALARALRDIYAYRRLVFVVGMIRNKNHTEYLRHILPIVNTLIVTEPDFLRKLPASELADAAERSAEASGHALEVLVEPDWKRALELARRTAGTDDLIAVSGSLYLLSDARSWLLNQTDSEKGW